MAAEVAVQPPLFSHEPSAFRSAISYRLSRAIPDLTPVSDSSGGSIAFFQSSKPLSDLLGSSGNPISCPFCAVPLARGSSARLCLTCGKTLGPLPRGTDGIWEASLAGRLLLTSLTLDDDKGRERRQALLSSMAALPEPVAFGGGSPGLDAFLGEADPPEMQTSAPVSDLQTFAAHPSPLHMFAHEPTSSSSSPSNNRRQRSSSGGQDFFNQMDVLDGGPGSAQNTAAASPLPSAQRTESASGTPVADIPINPAVKAALDEMNDLSFMLNDRLILPRRRSMPRDTDIGGTPAGDGGGKVDDDDDAEWGDFET